MEKVGEGCGLGVAVGSRTLAIVADRRRGRDGRAGPGARRAPSREATRARELRFITGVAGGAGVARYGNLGTTFAASQFDSNVYVLL